MFMFLHVYLFGCVGHVVGCIFVGGVLRVFRGHFEICWEVARG